MDIFCQSRSLANTNAFPVILVYDNVSLHSSPVLELTLKEKMMNQIPVISVISIMGTTEESAVDPLDEILFIREKLSKEVSLSFCLIFF